jgi:hypothetical protein
LGEQKSDTQYKSKNLIFREENITFMASERASERRTKIPFLLLFFILLKRNSLFKKIVEENVHFVHFQFLFLMFWNFQ